MKKSVYVVPSTDGFRVFLFETEYSTPIAVIVIINDVFPELISGNGKPVGGIAPLTTSAFRTV
jgi:hypothetical protein